MTLEGQNVVVVGGGSGIGLATTEARGRGTERATGAVLMPVHRDAVQPSSRELGAIQTIHLGGFPCAY